MVILFFLVLSYLLGSIPFGYLVAKQKNVDIRKVGSGNIGGTNVQRILGWRYGLVVYLLDIAKGVISTYLATVFFTNQSLIIVLTACTVVCGHVFSLYLHFKGGKGVATAAGTVLVILGFKLFLICFIIWLVLLYTTKIMSLTNLIVNLLIPLLVYYTLHSMIYTVYFIGIAGFILWTHRQNIIRLKNGTEKKLKLPRIGF